MEKRISAILYFLLIVAVACKNKETNHAHISPNNPLAESVFFDYLITGEEDNPDITIKAQLLEGDKNGKSFLLPANAALQLDGEPLKADSTVVTGAYYELQKNVRSFTGNHELVLKDIDGNEYSESFYFEPLSFMAEPATTLTRSGFKLQLSGVAEEEEIHLLMTDTVFGSLGINLVKKLTQSSLWVSAEEMNMLKSGPVAFELYREKELPITATDSKAGRIIIRYALRREWRLTD